MDNLYRPQDIVWIKNVSNKVAGQAYLDISEDEFILHFPTKHKTNALSPKVGEIIALYQNINGRKCFTHLVSPVENVLIEEDRENLKYGRKVRILAKTEINNSITVSSTFWNKVSFKGISQGNACRINRISGIESYEVLLNDLWSNFSPFLPTDLIRPEFINQRNMDSKMSAYEGKLKLVSHYSRERDSKIVRAKKSEALASNKLHCEVCGFSFVEKLGVNFIECHHKTPISQTGYTETNLDDLGLVCANCHRMLHKLFEGKFLTMEELKNRLLIN